MKNPEHIERVVIDGHSLTVEQAVAVARFGAKVEIAPPAVAAMQASRALVEKILDENRVAYGISTGFGEFSKVSVGREKSGQLQDNLIMSHCVAVGTPLNEETTRAMLLLRANALCVGNSGIRPEIVKTLVDMLNAGVHPVIPEKGSLGASGDLAPLSHMALVVLGMGEAMYKGEKLPGKTAMERAGLPTFRLQAKEGLALINGTQCMTAVGVLAYYDAHRAAELADIIGSMTLEALTGLKNAFDPRVHAVRPHAGQSLVAKNFRLLTENSELLDASQNLRVQDAYALRCIPQVHGAIRDSLNYIRGVVETEMNSVTDNPLLFLDDESVISGGNFHGEPMALVMDFLGIAVSEIADISERRLERLVNPALSNGLPAFLTPNGGLNSGYMICQYSAASMVSENKVYAHPASVDSIPSSANQEDIVSMGTTAARKSRLIVENTFSVLGFELMAAVQGLDLRDMKASPVHCKVAELVREGIPFFDKDREIRIDIEFMEKLIRCGVIENTVKEMIPEFC
ncbi:MAG: histidine ammonia-lyase [Clostridia bacterium]|nr:histidine ammonia-lyase [Clostridia bacterium]